jgi:hypothetical protein
MYNPGGVLCASVIVAPARRDRADSACAKVASARDAPARRAELFKILVFLIALPKIFAIVWLCFACLHAGQLAAGLPFAALALMSFSYVVKGSLEVVEEIRTRLK